MVQLSDELAKLVADEMREGKYTSTDDVLRAALTNLRATRLETEMFGDFAPGELAALVEVGMADIRAGRVVSHEELVAGLDRLSMEHRKKLTSTDAS